MSFDQKKNDNMNSDKSNIKSHLNTSLEYDGICVSEDLINRTLEAIRRDSEEVKTSVISTPIQQPKSKAIPWLLYARNSLAVAAAGLVLVLGLRSMSMKEMKSSDSEAPMDNGSYAEIKSEESTKGSYGFNGLSKEDASDMMDTAKSDESTKQSILERDVNYTMDASVANEAYPATAAEEQELAEQKSPTGSNALGIAAATTQSFIELYPFPVEKIEAITIIRALDEHTVVLREQTIISEFVAGLEGYSFKQASPSEGMEHSVVTIDGPSGSFVMKLYEDNIRISFAEGENTLEEAYAVTDEAQLLQYIEEWLK